MIHVLYVDDEEDVLALGKIFLEQNGRFSVTTACSAPVALTLLKSGNFDVIVSDYQMSEMDGILFLRKIRNAGNTIPFILFTVWEREKNITRALNEESGSYIQKGIDARARYAELGDAITDTLENRKIRKNGEWKEDQDSPGKLPASPGHKTKSRSCLPISISMTTDPAVFDPGFQHRSVLFPNHPHERTQVQENATGASEEKPGKGEQGKIPHGNREHHNTSHKPDSPAVAGQESHDLPVPCLGKAGKHKERERYADTKPEK